MSTVDLLIQRLFRTWLTPPDAQYAQVPLGADILADATEISLGTFTIPEDENLLRQGSILEAHNQLYRVLEWNDVTRVATVEAGIYGTGTDAVPMPAMVNLNPPYPYQSVFEAIRDNIIQLYPRLWTVETTALASVSGNVFPVKDDLIVEVIEAWPDQGMQDLDIDCRVVDYHPQAGGRAIVTNVPMGTGWFRYRRRMAVAQDPSDTLYELGVDTVWNSVVMAGAAADLMAGRDIPAAVTDWVGGVLKAENIQVGTRSSLSVGLARYRELLVDRFSKEMKAEDSSGVKVHMNEAFGSVS